MRKYNRIVVIETGNFLLRVSKLIKTKSWKPSYNTILGWCKPSRGWAFTHSINRGMGCPSIVYAQWNRSLAHSSYLIQSTCTSSLADVTIHCCYKGQGMRLNLWSTTMHASFPYKRLLGAYCGSDRSLSGQTLQLAWTLVASLKLVVMKIICAGWAFAKVTRFIMFMV